MRDGLELLLFFEIFKNIYIVLYTYPTYIYIFKKSSNKSNSSRASIMNKTSLLTTDTFKNIYINYIYIYF